jgi:hypothetical protein
MKWKDEIVEEVRTAKEAYAAQFDYDLERMFEDLKKHEEQNPAPRANLKPLKPHERTRMRITR